MRCGLCSGGGVEVLLDLLQMGLLQKDGLITAAVPCWGSLCGAIEAATDGQSCTWSVK
jgi:hypothetical protein